MAVCTLAVGDRARALVADPDWSLRGCGGGEEILPLLEGEAAGRGRATTIIEWLEEKFPGRFSASQLRTLQRRLQDWRALNGPE